MLADFSMRKRKILKLMKKTTIKTPAKLNLTLDVSGRENGYHSLDSLFLSVNLFDEITVVERKDEAIRLSFVGVSAKISPEKSKACLAARMFAEKFGTGGADIIVKRNIPSGGGLGGSSADAAGVLSGLAKLYGVSGALDEIANAVGSDEAFMLRGGFARVMGRGSRIEPLVLGRKFYFLILPAKTSVSTAQCFKRFDENGASYSPCTSAALAALEKNQIAKFKTLLKNDLYESAAELAPEIRENVFALGRFGKAVMTGAGSAVFTIFDTEKERNLAYKELKSVYGQRLVKAESL